MGRSCVLQCVVFVVGILVVTHTKGFIFQRERPMMKMLSDVFRAVEVNRRNLLRVSRPECNFPSNTCEPSAKYRSADGYCNNLDHPSWGAPGWPYRRMLESDYSDGESEPRAYGKKGIPLPSPREISRTLHTGDSQATQDIKLTSMFTQFGQFLDHDLSLTPKIKDPSKMDCCKHDLQFPVRGLYAVPKGSSKSFTPSILPLPGTCFPINIPQPDPVFTGSCMNFVRSEVFAPSFKCRSKFREQGNAITSFIDASQIYGSSDSLQKQLRMNIGGWLQMSGADLLPVNASTTCRSTEVKDKYCFGSGDVRVNEQPMLSALHVVFHRYHNYMASILGTLNSQWSDEKIYQETRRIVGAIMQHIVYDEYLPLVIGPHFVRAYSLQSNGFFQYNKDTDPRIINAFATAAFRFGHSMVPGHLMFGKSKVPLETTFFDPQHIQANDGSGLSSLIQGTINDYSQENDRFFSPSLTQKLFQNGSRSLDLVALNIQRGRDHGLPSYNDFREACGLSRLTRQAGVNTPFLSVYKDLDDIDLFSGAVGEKHVPGGVVGDTFACIIARQFRDLKFGDRFFYEHMDNTVGFSIAQMQSIKRMSLSSLLCEVSGIKDSQKNVFKAVSETNPLLPCKDIRRLDVMPWVDTR